MPSDSGERRPAKAQGYMGSHPPPKLTEPLPCPRCESTSTKFCYYNNYNLAQPRHFCKSCRRYWTHGGALRNVPVGGGTRKASSKRSRPSAAAPSSTTSSSSSSTVTHESESLPVPAPLPANLVSVLPGVKQEMGSTEVNLNESFVPGSETFAPLLSSQGQGFLALGGYGFGLGSGFDELGLGFGRGFWSVPGGAGGYLGVVGGGGCSGGAEEAAAPPPASGCNTWQDNDVEGGGLAGGDCFSWPGLEISMPGKGMK